jgi:hypothetical protein
VDAVSGLSRLRAFFFAPSDAFNLGFCRAVFCTWLFFFFLNYDVARWADWPAEAWTPSWFVAWFGPLPSAGVLSALGITWKCALVLGAVGLFRRVSLGVAAVLGAYAMGLTGSFVKLNYDVGLPVILLFVFWIARSTDALSIDAVIARRRGRPVPAASAEYTWPLALGRVLIALAFFAAGAAKMRHSGFHWITTDNLRWLFVAQQYTHHPPLDWAARIAEVPWLCRVIAAGTVGLEVGYPIALFATRLRPWIVVATMALQIGIQLFMGINYLAFLVANVVWVDWSALFRRVVAGRATTGA